MSVLSPYRLHIGMLLQETTLFSDLESILYVTSPAVLISEGLTVGPDIKLFYLVLYQ